MTMFKVYFVSLTIEKSTNKNQSTTHYYLHYSLLFSFDILTRLLRCALLLFSWAKLLLCPLIVSCYYF